ncbi:LLM class flavin-dependent oxidoreductase [Cellulomonas sp. APG4]|uniref:LLM class flavin-dependent oxidoreductase n=1 Tax=Cellulomonas sp. APG4 TaxID=1538656 RepID=UPI00137A5F99|nr:LLM class flavin-dependent oxidoreductase [Cellulomonas sp. APG4]NCT91760.1 LLM class flavin-dependent oxidoreductase [Cellulomonas sp. APG4]
MSDPTARPPLLFSAFVMNTTSHIVQGTWRLPDAAQTDHNSLDHWLGLARLLERGRFDVLFFADVTGLYGEYRGDHRKYLEAGLQVPASDPVVLLSALAAATEHLGLAVTSSVVQAHPFAFARQLSTLDHLSNGRVAWNIVTGYLENGFRNFGHDGLVPHDERYVWAEEYLDVVLKLWEGSWEDDALVQDRERGIHAHADKVHKINHRGARYSVEGPHLVSPSPQRTPLLFQAGSSPVGREFAARNAEATFIVAPHPQAARAQIEDTRRRAAAYGRRPEDLKFFPGLTFVVGSTEAEAHRRAAELDEVIDWDGHLAHLSGSLGVDLGHHAPDDPVDVLETEAVQSIVAAVRASVGDRQPTIRDLGRLLAGANRIVGTPEQIADALETWQDAGIDGVNVINVTRPGTYEEFVEHVTPVLQERGLQKREYEPGTLRHKVFGTDRLPDRHRGAAYRGAFARAEAPVA